MLIVACISYKMILYTLGIINSPIVILSMIMNRRPFYRFEQVLKSSNFCIYCWKYLEWWEKVVDHFDPIAAWGSNSMYNLFLSCRECNAIKTDKIFETLNDAREFIIQKRLKYWYDWYVHTIPVESIYTSIDNTDDLDIDSNIRYLDPRLIEMKKSIHDLEWISYHILIWDISSYVSRINILSAQYQVVYTCCKMFWFDYKFSSTNDRITRLFLKHEKIKLIK